MWFTRDENFSDCYFYAFYCRIKMTRNFCNAAFYFMSLLDVSHISYRNDERFVLKEIRFAQQCLQNIALAGATGSGKTTLLKIIAGLIEPTIGAVFFKEERLKGPNEKSIARPSVHCLSVAAF